ncbi:helical backbone metal receptor [Sporosarcina sp. 179-K 8C2 HS]|uniref:ABC transporter substrate-binding protein n=1 Tax=Sporosarcina sp. 179-K 8C2 HS TaxID=3142387 RepID=UPI00399F09F3
MNKTVVDQVGRSVTFTFPPKRIVSLCPGITDTLFALNLEEEIVGRTRFCIHPKGKVKNVPAVAGTKDIKLEAIQNVQPDLIIVEKEENTKEIVEELEKHFPVYVAEVQSVDDAFRMIEDMGSLTDRGEAASQLNAAIHEQFESLPKATGKRVGYVIWRKPYMVVGKDTYINSLLEKMGFINPFIEANGRYPVVTPDEFQSAALDYVLLASEPFPFKEKHSAEFLEIMPTTKPILIDGEMFWYGPRMMEAVSYFQKHLRFNSSKFLNPL